jgi:hypothetical protein
MNEDTLAEWMLMIVSLALLLLAAPYSMHVFEADRQALQSMAPRYELLQME